MRADRLISMLLLLQSRGRMSARALSEELEVSVRTVMRDLEALGSAGVPIYAERGPNGGYELWDGFRTQLSSVTREEVRAIGLLGMPGLARVLGFDGARTRIEAKLAQALPPDVDDDLTHIRQRYLVEVDTGADLAFWITAIERTRQVCAETDEGTVVCDPLGLVHGDGEWHVVWMVDDNIRTLPIASTHRVATTGKRFERPETFDLDDAWGRVSPR